MKEHLTVDDLARFRAGALPADEALRVGRHLGECRDCAAAARRSQDAGRAAEGFRAALRDEGSQRRAGWRWMLAAAAIVAFTVGAVLLYRAMSTTRQVRPASLRWPTVARIDYGRADWNALVDRALASGRIAVPADLAALRPAAGAVRSSGHDAAQGVEPRGVVVETDRPRFSWHPAPDGVSYRVVIYRGEREVMHSAELTATTYVPQRPLERGATYQWQVLITKTDRTMEAVPAPPAAPALIRVLSAADAADLAEARRRFPADPLLAGAIEARAGLLDDARRDLAAAAQRHPGDAAVARLRDSLPRP